MGKPAADTIVFPAIVYKVQTVEDDGLRVAFDLPESAILQAALAHGVQAFGHRLDGKHRSRTDPPHLTGEGP